MSANEELIRLLRVRGVPEIVGVTDAVLMREAAQALEAASQTRTASTVDELDALPMVSVLRTATGLLCTKYPAGWTIEGDDKWRDAAYIVRGEEFLTVLYTPPAVGEGSDREARRAPVQGPQGTISWDEHVEAHHAYAARYSNRQDADRIAERGGFGLNELRTLLGREPETFIPTAKFVRKDSKR